MASTNQYENNFTNLSDYGYNYTVKAYVQDLVGNLNSTEMRTYIRNTPPSVNLSWPFDLNVTIDRTPYFNWSVSNIEAQTLTYELNLTTYPTGSDDNRYVTGISSASHTLIGDLQYLSDNAYYYNWSIVAYDGLEYGNLTGERMLNISALVQSSLSTSEINFSTIRVLETNDTTNDNPAPFVLQNDGNSKLNTTINSTQAWGSVDSDSDYYKVKIDNVTGEEGAFSGWLSLISWTQMSVTGSAILAIAELGYEDSADSAEIDIYFETPPDEQKGNRNINFTITSSLGE